MVAPPQTPRCFCGERHAPFGIGPPLVEKQQWFCGTCVQFQPAHQADLAKKMREAIE